MICKISTGYFYWDKEVYWSLPTREGLGTGHDAETLKIFGKTNIQIPSEFL